MSFENPNIDNTETSNRKEQETSKSQVSNVTEEQRELELTLREHPEEAKKVVEENFKQENFELNGKEVKFMGVLHHPVTLKYHREDLEDEISKAGVVVFETAPQVSDPEIADGLLNLFKKLGVTEFYRKDLEIVFKHTQPTTAFYGELVEAAAKFKKPIAVVDPKESIKGMENLKIDERFEKMDEKTRIAKIAAVILGTAGFLAPDIEEKFKRMDRKETGEENSGKKEKPKKVSRRKFLKIAGGTSVAIGLSSLLSSFFEEKSRTTGTLEKHGRANNPFGPFLYSHEDYRNVARISLPKQENFLVRFW